MRGNLTRESFRITAAIYSDVPNQFPSCQPVSPPSQGAQIPFLIKPIPKGINISEPSPSHPGGSLSEGCACGGHPGRVRDGAAPSESVSQGALRTSLPSPQRCDVNAAPQAAPEREQSAEN